MVMQEIAWNRSYGWLVMLLLLLGLFLLASPAQAAVCGDGTCEFPSENDVSCAQDCGCASLNECTDNGGAVLGSICSCDDDCVSGICCDDADTVCGVVDPIDECPLEPLSGCKQATRSSIGFKNKGNNQSKLRWKWQRGEFTDMAEFRDPVNTTDGQFLICGYHESAENQLIIRAAIAPKQFCGDDDSRPCWSKRGDDDLQYRDKDKDALIWSIAQLRLTAGEEEEAAIQLMSKKGSGMFSSELSKDDMLEGSMTMQFIIRDSITGQPTGCWESVFDDPRLNRPGSFKAMQR